MTIVAVVLVLIAAIVSWCVLRFAHARRLAQQQLPPTGEVWTQDGQPLYVITVDNNGVRLRIGGTTQRDEWQESWATWAVRVRA
jgi:hypothetical protein